MLDDLRGFLGSSLQNDHSRQVVCENYIKEVFGRGRGIRRVLDLGCGDGNSIELFRGLDESVKWIGLDIDSSPEVAARTRSDAEFYSYDGVHMPFGDACFDLVYCKQVLEHVRRPNETLKEVRRVLKPGGLFVGSTSQLEPYHSYSFWNYTVYGFLQLLDEADLRVAEVRPGIDALTLIVRRLVRRPRFFMVFWSRESPLNAVIGVVGRMMRKSHASINLAKLLFCGQFCFVASRPVEN